MYLSRYPFQVIMISPINKRGSGVKRLILLSFFRAEAERRTEVENNMGIIYAIEEPETSQHSNNQRVLINALKKLAQANHTQVLLTTHSPIIVKELDFENLRLLYKNGNENDYKKGRPKRCYLNAKTQKTSDLVLTEYIRHQIHHPENHSNAPFTMNELKQSIEDMRNYIQDHMKAEKISESVADIE